MCRTCFTCPTCCFQSLEKVLGKANRAPIHTLAQELPAELKWPRGIDPFTPPTSLYPQSEIIIHPHRQLLLEDSSAFKIYCSPRPPRKPTGRNNEPVGRKKRALRLPSLASPATPAPYVKKWICYCCGNFRCSGGTATKNASSRANVAGALLDHILDLL